MHVIFRYGVIVAQSREVLLWNTFQRSTNWGRVFRSSIFAVVCFLNVVHLTLNKRLHFGFVFLSLPTVIFVKLLAGGQTNVLDIVKLKTVLRLCWSNPLVVHFKQICRVAKEEDDRRPSYDDHDQYDDQCVHRWKQKSQLVEILNQSRLEDGRKP